MRRLDYEASGGREVFLSFVDDDDTLFGLLRLRLDERACVRELHVYGPEVPLRPSRNPLSPLLGLRSPKVRSEDSGLSESPYPRTGHAPMESGGQMPFLPLLRSLSRAASKGGTEGVGAGQATAKFLLRQAPPGGAMPSGSPAAQHHGLGEALLSEAEAIARSDGYASLSVLSGVGAREYYRRLGYVSEGAYVAKGL